MTILILIAIMVLIALIGMDAHHDEYRQRWLRAMKLLAASDEARDQEISRRQHIEHALLHERQRAALVARSEEKLRAEVGSLKLGYQELYELGVELVAEREGAAAAHRLAAAAPKPPRTERSIAELGAEYQRSQDAYHQAMQRLLEEGGKGAAHTP